MNSKTSFFALIIFAISGLVTGDPSGRIVGGFPVPIQMMPYQASLQLQNSAGRTSHYCGASIISENFMVTACHCVQNLEATNLAILVGTAYKNQPAQRNKIKRIILNKNYDSKSQDYDIALIELSRPLQFNEKMQPIPLANASDNIPDGTMCLVSGWGERREFALTRRNQLRATEVPIVNSNECNRDYDEFGGITPRMLCAGMKSGGRDACQGDSGGPLACPSPNRDGDLILVGIVSWGIDCAQPEYPGVYASIVELRKWISAQTGL